MVFGVPSHVGVAGTGGDVSPARDRYACRYSDPERCPEHRVVVGPDALDDVVLEIGEVPLGGSDRGSLEVDVDDPTISPEPVPVVGLGVQNGRAFGGRSHGPDGGPQHGTTPGIQSCRAPRVGEDCCEFVEARTEWRQIRWDADQCAMKVAQGLTGVALGDLQAVRQVRPR